ncbi:MAG TPA: phosphoribosylamine--glycine ligase [bacterium]
MDSAVAQGPFPQVDMNVLLIGGGGREHALAWKIAASPRVTKLFASPGSAAIAQYAQCVALNGHAAMVDFATREKIDLAVVGPEAPLVEGLADAFRQRNIAVFGPSAFAAQLEGSKAFAKDFMQRHGIPTAASQTFHDLASAMAHVEQAPPPYVVKADGLAAGKGVMICRDREAGKAAIRTIMQDKAFGAAGGKVVIEQFLTGEEASYFVITDGKDFITLPSCQDHKTIGELDQGPNTGGMGAYCPAPVVTPEVEQRVIEEVVKPTLHGMAAEGYPYVGVIYVGLMIDGGKPSVVEYNCRFGDPECQPLMMMLDSDLVVLLDAAARGQVAKVHPRWKPGAAACIVMASGGYPGDYPKGIEITGLDHVSGSDACQVFHAGTRKDGTRWLTNGGRVLGVTAWGADLGEALSRGYRAAEAIDWKGAVLRRDIGLKGLRHAADRRPKINVGVLAPTAPVLAEARAAVTWLEHLGLGVQSTALDGEPHALRAWLRTCEDAGAGVMLALPAEDARFPERVAAMTPCPVVAPLGRPKSPPPPHSGAGSNGVCWAAGGPVQAAQLAAQLLSLKYPDVWAALKRWRLEQELTGASARPGTPNSTLI